MSLEQPLEMEISREEGHMEIEKPKEDGRLIYHFERFSKRKKPKIREIWPTVGPVLKEHGILCMVCLDKCYFRIRTSRSSRNPDIFERAKDFLRLICKTDVSLAWCIRILNGDLRNGHIKIGFQDGGLCKIHGINKDQFKKQRKSLRANNKELGLILGCQIYINGDSVTAVSTSLESINTAKNLVERCFVENVDAADLVKLTNTSCRQAAEGKLECLRI